MLQTNGIRWAFWATALFLCPTGCAPKNRAGQILLHHTSRAKELKKGTVDAVIGDFPVIAYEARESAGNLDVAGQQFDKQTLGIGVAKNSEKLTAVVTNALARNGEQGLCRQLETVAFLRRYRCLKISRPISLSRQPEFRVG